MAHRLVVALVASVALAALRASSCDSDRPRLGPNAPCTRSSDCEVELMCLQGLCAPPDAGDAERRTPARLGDRWKRRRLRSTVDIRREATRCPTCKQRFSRDARFCPFDGARLETAPFDPLASTRCIGTRSTAATTSSRPARRGRHGPHLRGAPRGARPRVRDEGPAAASSRRTPTWRRASSSRRRPRPA